MGGLSIFLGFYFLVSGSMGHVRNSISLCRNNEFTIGQSRENHGFKIFAASLERLHYMPFGPPEQH